MRRQGMLPVPGEDKQAVRGGALEREGSHNSAQAGGGRHSPPGSRDSPLPWPGLVPVALPSCLRPPKLSEQKGGERSWFRKGVRYTELQQATLTPPLAPLPSPHTPSLMPGRYLQTSFRESLSPGCRTTSLPPSSPPFPFLFLLSKPLTPSSVVGGRAFSHSSHPTPHPRHLTPKRNGFL